MAGYVKEYRSIMEWEWYTDYKTAHLFRHCIYKANIESKKWHGIVIERGSFVTSLANLSKETGLSIQNVRTSLNKLKSTQELTYKTTSRNTIITINNYNQYQDTNTNYNKQLTNNQQTTNKQLTTTKEREERKEYSSSSSIENKNFENFSNQKLYGKYNNVCLTAEQYNRLLGICASHKLLDDLVDSLSENIETGEEQPYRAEFPNAHSIRLEKYYEWRRKHPPKQQKKEVDGWSL